MLIQNTVRHMQAPQSLRTFIESGSEKLERYIDGMADVHLVRSSEKYRQIAEVNVHNRGNIYPSATKATEDLKIALT